MNESLSSDAYQKATIARTSEAFVNANPIAETVTRAAREVLNDYNLEYLWQGKKVRPYGRAGIDLEFKVSKAVSIMGVRL